MFLNDCQWSTNLTGLKNKVTSGVKWNLGWLKHEEMTITVEELDQHHCDSGFWGFKRGSRCVLPDVWSKSPEGSFVVTSNDASHGFRGYACDMPPYGGLILNPLILNSLTRIMTLEALLEKNQGGTRRVLIRAISKKVWSDLARCDFLLRRFIEALRRCWLSEDQLFITQPVRWNLFAIDIVPVCKALICSAVVHTGTVPS